VETSVEHGEQNSHLAMAPQNIRDLLQRITRKVGTPETPVVMIASSGIRYFLRQMAEPTLRNLYFVSHNEVPSEVKIISLGAVQ